MDRDGWNTFDWANRGFFQNAKDGDLEDKGYEVIVELMQQAENDIAKDSSVSQILFSDWATTASSGKGILERPITPDLAYIQRLKELGFRLNDVVNGATALVWWMLSVQESVAQLSPKSINAMLLTILSLGAAVCTADQFGYHPLHWIFMLVGHDRAEAGVHNAFEIVTALLQNGADPCALADYGYSVFDVAEFNDCTSIFLEALEQAGFDINEVRCETEWRQWCFKNPDHGFGESTAVDDAQVGPPSRKGLVSRRAIRGDRLED
ncbi:MAG: hypothetical protein Q9188_000994 [Gyalolechia gomerana]